MRTSLNQNVPASHPQSSPEVPGGQRRLSQPSPSGATAGSKRSAASAGLDALPQRSPSGAPAGAPAGQDSTGPQHKRPRLTIGELSRRAARPEGSNASPAPQAPVRLALTNGPSHAPSDASSHAPGHIPTDVPNHATGSHVLGRHFDAHETHHLPDILHRLQTLHHDYGEHLTPEAINQLKHEIRQLHDVAKMVLDIKKRLMRRKK